MSQASPPRPPEQAGKTLTNTASAPELLAVLDDDYAREILLSLYEDAKAARELVESSGMSKPTVYRRLNRLEAVGLVETTVACDPDGHHRKRFQIAVDALSIQLGDSGLSVDVTHARVGDESTEP